MRFRFLVFLSLLFAGFALQASDKPKLIVGIVVDQMRYDYLVRFKSGFGAGGFNRLLEGGRNFTSCNYNYIPTYTAPGHASIYTGTTPRVHGIVGNSWYDRRSGKAFSNVYDSTVTPIGSDEKAGLASPVNLMAPTIGDHLKAQLGKGTRVFSVSIKDRGAILPGGKAANGAFWYDSKSGLFTTSSYYYREAPVWLTEQDRVEVGQRRMADLGPASEGYLRLQQGATPWGFHQEERTRFAARASTSRFKRSISA